MSRYTRTLPIFDPYPGRRYRTVNEIEWEIGRPGSAYWITVPRRYIFDVSIPWYARRVFDPHAPEYFKASALHDYLLGEGWDRLTSGAIFAQALKADRVPSFARLVMWLAVSTRKWS